jgi:hypothetical protein
MVMLQPKAATEEAPKVGSVTEETPKAGSAAPAPLMTSREAAVAMTLGVFLILLTALAIRHSEMVTGRYISHGIPPLPAFTFVLVLGLLKPVLQRKAPRLAPTRGQILLVYIMLTVATVLSGAYQIRAFLPHLVALQYQERPEGQMPSSSYASFLPSWLAPHNPKVVLDYYNGASDGAIPWTAWLTPLAAWSLFLIALFTAVYCLMQLVQKQWTQNEKLSFPLLILPLAMTMEDQSTYGSKRLAKSLFLFGFGCAVAFNGLNILHIIRPAIPSPGFYMTFTESFGVLDRPWTPLGSISIFYMLEAIGIGYFVPLEVTFSAWFFYICNRLFAVAGSAAGYDQTGFPFTQEQSAGGYLAMGFTLLWSLRHTFRESWRRSFHRLHGEEPALRERWAWIGLISTSVFVLGFCYAAGFSLKLAIPFFAILFIFVLVYARIRAETGVPFGFIYPFSLPKEGLINGLGFQNALGMGGPRAMVLFSTMAWLSRHHLMEEHAAYQLDGIKLAREGRIGTRTVTIALLLAFVVGLGAAYWVHLSAYYAMGSNMAAGGAGAGEFRAIVAQQEYQQMASHISSPPARDSARLLAISGGFLFTLALQWLRLRWIGSPFHPIGFLISTAYGDSSALWFPLFVAWMLKALLLKLGGLRMYRTGIPFFLGLTIGHFFMAGILWPVFSLFLAPEASRAYHIYFGG